MHPLRLAPLAAFLLAAPASVETVDPFEFFSGRTENTATIKVLLKKPYRTHTVGTGRVERDGTLVMVQTVTDGTGNPPLKRNWRVRKTGPGRYVAAMSEAVGPVTIEQVGNRYRFKFNMKGKLSVEQWLVPLPGGLSARNTTKVRKMGVTVATSDGVIHKVRGT